MICTFTENGKSLLLIIIAAQCSSTPGRTMGDSWYTPCCTSSVSLACNILSLERRVFTFFLALSSVFATSFLMAGCLNSVREILLKGEIPRQAVNQNFSYISEHLLFRSSLFIQPLFM